MPFLRRRDEWRPDSPQALQAAAVARWQDEWRRLHSYIEAAETFAGVDHEDMPDVHVQLKRDERIFLIVRGSALVEPQRDPGHWEGTSSGFSVRLVQGLSYRVGGSRGTYQRGEEKPRIIDQGGVGVITNQRVRYQGTVEAREWAFSRLLGFHHDTEYGMTTFQVANRQKASGFVYGLQAAPDVHFRLELALAHHSGGLEQLVAELKEALAVHERTPVQALPPQT